MPGVPRILELVVACLLLYSGLLHLSNPYLFANAIAAYRLLPLSLLAVVPFVLPQMMLVLAVCLISQRYVTTARLGAAILFATFAVAQATAWLAGNNIGCGCFGYANEPISPTSIAIPVLCAAVCAVLLWRSDALLSQRIRPET